MCGIAGIVRTSAASGVELRPTIERLQQAMAHRGPDGWGNAVFEGATFEERGERRAPTPGARSSAACAHGRSAALGHRRLAIIDLTPTGHQPMTSPARKQWISYNGELYNYRLLRDELVRDGEVFYSESDTEVLLTLVARHGPEALQKLRGMFAFAVWNDDAGDLLLVRDRFGIKPLYYSCPRPGTLLFGSEIGALLASGLVSRDVDPDAEAAFLSRGSIAAPRTYFRDIHALPPGHWARWDGSRLTLTEYWSVDDVLVTPVPLTEVADAAAAVRRAVTDSVGVHLVSDVPVGVFLSGGIDSALIAGAMLDLGVPPPRTFTVVVPGTMLDEAAAARRAAEYYGTDHSELTVENAQFEAAADRFIAAMDQPTVDGLNSYVVAETVARAGLKVALSGVGGDELLGGYPSFRDVPRLLHAASLLARIPGAPALTAFMLDQGSGRSRKLAAVLRAEPTMADAWRAYRALFTTKEVEQLTGRRSNTRSEEPQRSTDGSDPFWTIARAEITGFMIPQLLRDADVFAMTHGLEVRTPLVDHIVLETVHRAGRWSLDGAATAKLALARALGDFLPPGHSELPKRGFTLPFDAWLRKTLTGTAATDDVRACLDTPPYRPFVEGYLRGRVHWSRVWALYVLERFRAMHSVGD
jgi:asparagine synthase (glutamine-hydrolysing)